MLGSVGTEMSCKTASRYHEQMQYNRRCDSVSSRIQGRCTNIYISNVTSALISYNI